jgi:hypothetical protein
MLLAEGRACPTRKCKFIDYEDLPVYSADKMSTLEIVSSDDKLEDKLPVYSIVA